MKKIYFCFPVSRKLTGQELASRLILKQLHKDFDFSIIHIPAFDREQPKLSLYPISYVCRLIIYWGHLSSLLFRRNAKVYFNLGQGILALIRDGLPLCLIAIFKKDMRLLISLHGHIFTKWQRPSFKMNLLVKVLQKATCVTVLGPIEKDTLLKNGVAEKSVRIINNTCDITHSYEESTGTVNLLFLSNLLEVKGYKIYLQYLEKLSEILVQKPLPEVTIKAVLCGQITNNRKFFNQKIYRSKYNWIEDKIARINRLGKIKVSWVQGAYGSQKQELFSKSDLFIFPSYYAVEAQPIVLIEAMAASCAIITTGIGEINSMINNESAVKIKSENQAVAEIYDIIQNQERMKHMQQASHKRFAECFSPEIYKKTWQETFNRLCEKQCP